ncbi:tRNA pseudouridine synthase B [Staphylococcus gallinarum]|uniref:tRNA pseudouridine synthase B n=1 Tax=Staphylococcus gallinarum TaxID=1293 RepID=A0A380FH44_STAGA|nr:tRNA pseudouridine synthase B [Staphylococcus gallinarum]
MYNGILPVYKERGLTSHDVVFKIKENIKNKKSRSYWNIRPGSSWGITSMYRQCDKGQ